MREHKHMLFYYIYNISKTRFPLYINIYKEDFLCYFLFIIEYCHCGSGVLDVLPIIPDDLCYLSLVLKEFKYFQQMITDLHMLPTVN